ncbi:MAG: GDYXXLXY domain-containing protein [Proteobacteria bacterium]|nr:GDYXXLXY domain-containing protein [Pseudomonadota bacterium]
MNLWLSLKEKNLVKGEMPKLNSEATFDSIWYIRLMQGIAGWIAALFMLGFLAMILDLALFRANNPTSILTVALLCNISAYFLFLKLQKNEFMTQLALVVSLAGQLLFAWGLFDSLSNNGTNALFALFVYQMVLAFVMPNFIHRLLSTWFSMFALFWAMGEIELFYLAKVMMAVAFVGLWMNERSWGGVRNKLFEPIGYGLAIALMQINTHVFTGVHIFSNKASSNTDWWYLYSPWLATLILAGLFVYVVYRFLLENKIALNSRAAQLSAIGAVVLMLSGTPVVGAGSAILVLLVGFSRQRKALIALGVLALISFISWYYYNLSISLLYKSLILLVAGLLMLLGRVLSQKLLEGENETNPKPLKPTITMNKSKWVILISMLVSIGLVNSVILKKENILKNGQSVLLELAPVDPRSLMQGDYMRLRFAIAVEINKQNSASDNKEENPDGFVIVDLDENLIGTFFALDTGQQLKHNQIKLQYRTRNHRIQFATNAFFFQEGKAPKFDEAKYGEFKVSQKGELLLKNLVDEQFKVIGENRK